MYSDPEHLPEHVECAGTVPDPRPDFDHECFLISPIGADDSDVRRRADGVREYIVKPAAEELGLTPVRADDIAQPGQITLQVIEHVLTAKAAVADLTGANPNVFYELAVRHTARLPVVLIAHEDHRDKLPFDIAQMRTVFYDHQDLKSAADCRTQIAAQLHEALEKGAVDSPVAASVNLAHLQGGNPSEQVLAQLVSSVESIAADNGRFQRTMELILDRSSGIDDRGRFALESMTAHVVRLAELSKALDDPELQRICAHMTDVLRMSDMPRTIRRRDRDSLQRRLRFLELQRERLNADLNADVALGESVEVPEATRARPAPSQPESPGTPRVSVKGSRPWERGSSQP